jgi:hypothetical protein
VTESGHGAGKSLDPDDIYRQIGLFVVVFQSLETVLVEICWLTTEPQYASDGRRVLAGLSFPQLVKEAGKRVDAFIARHNLDDTEFRNTFLINFHGLLEQCRALAQRRNRIVHSAYIHFEGGDQLVGIMQSDMFKAVDGPDVAFDQEMLTSDSFHTGLHDIALVAFGLSQSKVQLVHWLPH